MNSPSQSQDGQKNTGRIIRARDGQASPTILRCHHPNPEVKTPIPMEKAHRYDESHDTAAYQEWAHESVATMAALVTP